MYWRCAGAGVRLGGKQVDLNWRCAGAGVRLGGGVLTCIGGAQGLAFDWAAAQEHGWSTTITKSRLSRLRVQPVCEIPSHYAWIRVLAH